jgi:hypothetical protein
MSVMKVSERMIGMAPEPIASQRRMVLGPVPEGQRQKMERRRLSMTLDRRGIGGCLPVDGIEGKGMETQSWISSLAGQLPQAVS